MATSRIIGTPACCGATVSRAKTYSRARSKGIYIFAGTIGTEKNTKKDEIKHIKTKNGELTIAVKLDW